MSEHAQESVDEPISTQNATQPDTDESAVHATQAALEAAVAEHKDQLLRVRADSENFKRRLQQDKETAVKFALESFIRDLIPILDGFDQAMAFATPAQDKASDGQTDQTSVVSGFVLIQQQILGLLEKSSVVPIQTDGAFDPHCHQAISQVASDTVPANHIVQVVQTGYTYYDRVVRPAMVIVSTGPDTKSGETSANQSEEKAVKKEKKEQ